MKRKRLKLVGMFVVFVMLTACMLLPDFAGQKRAGKYEPTNSNALPLPHASTPLAEQQIEPHTCGLHAMRSLYRAYGLDPDAFRLRFRLGTDEPAVQIDDETTGTLHPDLYRVLAQDGFATRTIDLDAAQTSDLNKHLAADQLAIMLVYRKTYHWVLLSDGETTGQITVIDSLSDEPKQAALADVLRDALSITLVEPAPTGGALSAADAHALGLAEMSRAYQRR